MSITDFVVIKTVAYILGMALIVLLIMWSITEGVDFSKAYFV